MERNLKVSLLSIKFILALYMTGKYSQVEIARESGCALCDCA